MLKLTLRSPSYPSAGAGPWSLILTVSILQTRGLDQRDCFPSVTLREKRSGGIISSRGVPLPPGCTLSLGLRVQTAASVVSSWDRAPSAVPVQQVAAGHRHLTQRVAIKKHRSMCATWGPAQLPHLSMALATCHLLILCPQLTIGR